MPTHSPSKTLEADGGIEPPHSGVAVRRLSSWLTGRVVKLPSATLAPVPIRRGAPPGLDPAATTVDHVEDSVADRLCDHLGSHNVSPCFGRWRCGQESNLRSFRPTVFKTAPRANRDPHRASHLAEGNGIEPSRPHQPGARFRGVLGTLPPTLRVTYFVQKP